MISYLTNKSNGYFPSVILSEKTANETPLFPATRNYFLNKLHNCERDKLYLQIPVAFDIETTNFTMEDNKLATMYIWQFSFKFGSEMIFIYGRTWREWEEFMYLIRRNIDKKKIIIYVHNLSFEFHWIYTHIYFTKVFARKKRHPIYCESDKIIFKCSYILTNYGLRSLAENRGYTEKEELNYSLIRHYNTPINNKELSYCLVDVKIICELISDEIKRNGKIQAIPLTATGYARSYCLQYLEEHTNLLTYQNRIRKMFPTDPDLFGLLFKAFAGGFTHANYNYIDIVLENLQCHDRTSFYPSMMCSKRFPMRFYSAKPEDIQLFTGKAMLMECEFQNIEAITSHSILSKHKCLIEGDELVDNGRVRFASKLTVALTDLDYETLDKFYKYDFMTINKLYVADYDYLPKELIEAILQLYKNKTKLKGVVGEEEKYMRSKELVNSMYGMMVTNPLNDEILFEDGNWGLEEVNTEEGLQKYVNSNKIFSTYQWGVWVTAWARHDLLQDVYEIGDDVVYCDTDSIKNLEDHNDVFEKSNQKTLDEIDEVINHYKLDPELFYPKTIKGEVKPLGVWDEEEPYPMFKTLGAKRYCYCYEDDYFNKNKEKLETEDNFFITVAGAPKGTTKDYIMKIANDSNLSPFDVFSYDEYKESPHYLQIPKEYSGKVASHYSDSGFRCSLTDYLGNIANIEETSYIMLEAIPFEFSLSIELENFLSLVELIIENAGSFDEKRIKFSKE